MSAEGVLAGSITGVVVGVVTAFAMKKALDTVSAEDRRIDLENANREGYKEGYAAAGNSVEYVRKRYQAIFGTTKEE